MRACTHTKGACGRTNINTYAHACRTCGHTRMQTHRRTNQHKHKHTDRHTYSNTNLHAYIAQTHLHTKTYEHTSRHALERTDTQRYTHPQAYTKKHIQGHVQTDDLNKRANIQTYKYSARKHGNNYKSIHANNPTTKRTVQTTQADRSIDAPTDRPTNRPTDRPKERQTDRLTDGQIGRKTHQKINT